MAFSRSQIFDPEFLASVKRLRMVARRVPTGGRFAEQRSVDAGSGIDFKDFRPYSPGDDFRAIDWNIYQRLGKVFLRLYEELEDLPLYLMPDVSQSLFHENPPRVIAGLRTCLALAAIGWNHHDTVGVFPFSDRAEELWRPQSGGQKMMLLAERLAALEPGGSTNIVEAMRDLQRWRLRRGLVVVISDFFDPAGTEAIAKALQGMRHRLLLVPLIKAADREPGISGDVRLVDCETGRAEDVSVTESVRQRYVESYDRFQDALAQCVRRQGGGMLRVDVEQDIAGQLAQLFERGSYQVR